MATERVTIVVSSKGTVTVRKEIEEIGNASKKSASALGMLKTALGAVAGVLSVATITKYADAYTNLQNRLKVVTKGTEELSNVTNQLYNIAQSTYSSFEGVSTIFARTAQATKDLGYSTEDALRFTEQLSKATQLSGVSAESANAALIQLSQGLASGTLRGEELNSLLEQLPYAANALAQGLGVPIGKLRELGQAGALTPKMIIDAFNNMNASINADFANLTPTIAMGLQTIENGFTRLIGLLNESTGAFGMIASVLVFVGNNLEYVALALSPLLVGLAALAVRAAVVAGISGLGAIVSALGALVPVLNMVRTALIALNLAFLASPMVLIPAAIAAAVTGLLLFGKHVLELMGLWDGFVQAAVDAFNTVYEYAAKFFNWISGGAWSIDIVDNGAAEAIVDADNTVSGEITSSITEGGDVASNTIKDGVVTGGDKLTGAMDNSFDNGGKTINANIEKGSMTFMQALKQTFSDILSWFRDLFSKTTADIKNAAAATKPTLDAGKKAGGDISKALNSGTKQATETITKSQDASGQKVGSAIEKAGEKAGKSISGGGGAAAAAIETAVKSYAKASTVGGTMSSYHKEASGTLGVVSKNSANSAVGNRYQGSGYRTGGQFMVGGTGGEDSQTVNFRASPNERVTVETPAQQRANDAASAGAGQSTAPNITSVVVLDPKAMLEIMNTRAGQDTFVQFVTVNREEVRQILGVA